MFKNVASSFDVSIVDSFQNPSHKVTSGHTKQEVALIPFYDWTAKLHSMKLEEDIYYPLWRHIRIALDKQDRR